MKALLAAIVLGLVSASTAMAFDAPTQAVLANQKIDKPIAITDVATLMQASERWCYLEEAGTCGWSDVYLAVGLEGAAFEISNAWDENIDIAFIDHGTFESGKSICETSLDWLPSLRADGAALGGRALRDLKRRSPKWWASPVATVLNMSIAAPMPGHRRRPCCNANRTMAFMTRPQRRR